MVVDQAVLEAVLDGVRAEHGSKDFGDGIAQGRQPGGLGAAVGDEQALVLAGEGRAAVVLEQAGRADNERHIAEVVDGQRQPLDDLGRQGRVLEHVRDVGKFLPHLAEVAVL